jgi:hypothetical protein
MLKADYDPTFLLFVFDAFKTKPIITYEAVLD